VEPRRAAVGFIDCLGHIVFMSKSAALKEPAEELRRFIRDADKLVRCLTIEFEIELGLGSAVVPVGKKLELAPPQAPLRERGASDGDAHAWYLPGDPAFFGDRFGRGDHAARDEPGPPSFSLAKTKIVSPLAMCLPPYIVFCALNAKVSPHGSLTSALIANIILFISHH